MTAADTNVRPAPPARRASRHRAPASGLACLLLSSARRLRLFLFVLPMSMSACIIPAGPEFRDPGGAPNAAPRIVSLTAPFGAILQGDEASVRIEIRIEDHNVEDTLYVRWVVDYPPFVQGLRQFSSPEEFPPSPDGQPRRAPQIILCQGLQPLQTHRITAIVADRPFVLGSPDPYTVEPGGETTPGWWFWDASDCRY